MRTIEQYHDVFEARFPSTDIQVPWDLGEAVYELYSQGKMPDVRLTVRGTQNDRSRTYLGASMLGAPCLRRLWTQYRGMTSFPGRIRRLFGTGDAYEARMQAELQALGFEFGGDQSRFEAWGGKVAGHTDGFVRLPEMPWLLLEAKTANRRRANDLKKKIRDLREAEVDPAIALEQWEPKYWTQIHLYMSAFSVDACLYLVTCKDRDEIIALLIERDDSAVRKAAENAKTVLGALDTPPPRGWSRPQQPDCTRFCEHSGWCWYGEDAPRDCALCIHWRHGGKCALGGMADGVCDDFELVAIEGQTMSIMDM